MIDANLNRSTEGIRVAEDIVRFVLDDGKLTSRLKEVRHQVVKLLRDERWEMRDARNTRTDVGAKRTTKSEAKRANILDVFMANIKRAEESVRVFEETSKLIDNKLSPKFKKIRFELYDIEQKAALLLKKKISLDFNLYVITDPSFGRTHMEIMRAATKGGASAIQLRDKTMTKQRYLQMAKSMAAYAQTHGLTFIVNDYPEVALKSGADGVHLGAGDWRSEIRGWQKKGKIIGISASNLKEAMRAEQLGADYIGFGPVFGTPIKPNAKPSGIKELARVMKRVTIPIVAVGGINKHNIKKIKMAGCEKVAVIRAICASNNIVKATRELLRLVNR
jgi:thiamine-phosphate pyrophosphorylase